MTETPRAVPGQPQPDGGWAWVVLAGTVSSQVLAFGFYSAAAVYVPVWMDDFNSSATDASLVISLSSFFMGFWSVVAGVLITRFSVRSVWIAGGLLSASGLLISAFATGTLYLTWSMSLVTALGFSMCVNSGLVVLSIYFKNRLTLAMGIASSGFAAGQIALTPLLEHLIYEYGWRGSMAIFGAIALHEIAAGALARPLPAAPKAREPRSKPGQPSPIKTIGDEGSSEGGSVIDGTQSRTNGGAASGSDSPLDDDPVRVCLHDMEVLWQKTDDDEEEATVSEAKIPADAANRLPVLDPGVTDTPRTSAEKTDPLSTATRRESNPSLAERCRRHLSRFRSFMLDKYGLSGLFRNPSFVLTLPVGVAHGFGWASVVFHLDARAESLGLQDSQGAMLLTLMGVGAFVTSISHGWFVDKGYISPIMAYILGILCNLVCSFLLSTVITFGPMIATCVLFGMATGVAEPVIFVTLQVLVQPSEVAGATSILLVCWGVGEIVGATLAGWIYDTFASYDNAYFMSGSAFAIGAFLAAIIFLLERRKTLGDAAGAVDEKQGPCTVVVNPMYMYSSNNEFQQGVHSVSTATIHERDLGENGQESSC